MNLSSVARGLRSVSIYRRLLCRLTVLSLAAGATAQAEKPAKPRRSARAVALIEWKKDAKGALEPRLLPISLLWEGKYYDAGLYEASPRPLALEPGTVYEAMRGGVPAGLFTVRGAREVRDVWYGDGVWSPGVTGSAKTGSEDERPRLKRATPASAPPPQLTSSSTANAEPEPYDPNRPTLHRGQPASAPAAPPPPAAAPRPAPAPEKSAEKPELLVAISDAELQETRPYPFPWNRDEEERLTGEMKAFAEAEVARSAGGKPTLDQVRVRAFDLNTDNLPEIVLTARATVAKAAPKGQKGRSANYYVTVVARVTVSGELRKLFQSVAPSYALDSVPRMELVDAVDADGDGPAELLFALVTDSGRRYAIYRVGRDELWKLVESGPVPND